MLVKIMSRELEKRLDNAESYEEWSAVAQQYDERNGLVKWKQTERSILYDNAAIRRRLDHLSVLRRANDNQGLLFTLNEGIHGNLGGMGKSGLYQKAKFGTKQLITEYVDEVTASLEHLAKPKVAGVTRDEKLDFFERAKICFGNSAFMMSGSGIYLFFHLGVVKALWEQGLIPEVISGSSGGAYIAALVGSRPDADLGELFEPGFMREESHMREILDKASPIKDEQISVRELHASVERLIPDLTFEEAYEVSGKRINISIAPAEKHQKSRLLNAITSPNVMLREAVIASCSVPGVFPPVVLAAKDVNGDRVPYLPSRKWVDGSVSDDLPKKRLSRLYGVNHFIVSQTNPLVLPFISAEKDSDTVLSMLTETSLKTAKDWGLVMSNLIRRPLREDSRLSKLINAYISIVSQTYTGDINILPKDRILNPVTALRARDQGELDRLVLSGERSAWPLLEKIRIQTKISRKLNEITQRLHPKKPRKGTSPKGNLKVVAKQ
ncbi:MAG: DUF3336 domain-containing protein [Gammaproteobacteria bacterium]|nr:DUF3336 domain-containing protein [Gammaproteobacteria bacterium]